LETEEVNWSLSTADGSECRIRKRALYKDKHGDFIGF